MTTTTGAVLAALLCSSGVAAPAGGDKAPPAKQATTPAAAKLEALKSLAGTWTGKAEGEGAAPFDATVEYRVTAQGTAVMETLFAGTPHEMVTVYHLDGNDLVLTHYCAGGNQPTMRAAPSNDPRTMNFEFVRGTNMKPTDMHMHSAKLVIRDDSNIEAEWVSWKDGKAAGTAKFALTRKR